MTGDSRPGDSGPGDPGAHADLMNRADLIIDGLLGIGGRGGLREPYAGLARQARWGQAGARPWWRSTWHGRGDGQH